VLRGTISLPIPVADDPYSWTIDVSVGGYSADTLLRQVTL
jgi:hypothetical protein